MPDEASDPWQRRGHVLKARSLMGWEMKGLDYPCGEVQDLFQHFYESNVADSATDAPCHPLARRRHRTCSCLHWNWTTSPPARPWIALLEEGVPLFRSFGERPLALFSERPCWTRSKSEHRRGASNLLRLSISVAEDSRSHSLRSTVRLGSTEKWHSVSRGAAINASFSQDCQTCCSEADEHPSTNLASSLLDWLSALGAEPHPARSGTPVHRFSILGSTSRPLLGHLLQPAQFR